MQSQPEQYQRMAMERQQAINNRDRALQHLQQLQTQNTDRRQLMKTQQASVSRDMLPSEIPNWSRDRYNELADYAVDNGLYTADEMKDLTDWRVLKLLDTAQRVATAPKSGKALKAVGGNKPPAKSQQNRRGVPQNRNAAGQFQSTKAELFNSRGGDKGLTRQYFKDKLAAERESGR